MSVFKGTYYSKGKNLFLGTGGRYFAINFDTFQPLRSVMMITWGLIVQRRGRVGPGSRTPARGRDKRWSRGSWL